MDLNSLELVFQETLAGFEQVVGISSVSEIIEYFSRKLGKVQAFIQQTDERRCDSEERKR